MIEDSLVPRPPSFTFTIIHGSGRPTKNGKAWEHSSRERRQWMQGGCRGGRGPTAKTTHWIIRLSALSQFLESRRYHDRKYLSLPAKNSLSSLVYIHSYLYVGPSPLHHLASTDVMNVPRPSPFFASRVYCERKWGRPGNEARWRRRRPQCNPSVEDLS